MKWIKASERLPNKKGCYCIIDHRYDNRRSESWYSPNGKNGNSLLHRYPNDISWLDESGKKEVEEIKKYIAGLRIDALKNHGQNTALLVFIQRLEESFTWVRDFK